MTHKFQHIVASTDGAVMKVELSRPEVHNAFNRLLIAELQEVFQSVGAQPRGEVRVVVLSGSGLSFCAGADVNWMKASLEFTHEENIADATRMADMFATIDKCPIPVVCRAHGAALGGGAGLVAVSDIVVAEEGTRFAFSEAKLGIAPAVISPFVLRKIGQGNARALFFTAERFDAQRALRIGLIHEIATSGKLDEAVARVVGEILTSAPLAIRRAKDLIANVPAMAEDEARSETVKTIAELRTGIEGQEGLRAFLAKRRADWCV